MPRALGNELQDPDQYLWRKVIFRAQEEAEGMYVYDSRKDFVMRMAQKWLCCSRDFFEVCRLANIDHERAQDLRDAMREKYGR